MAKRKISVGFIKPNLDENDDMIYVQLRIVDQNCYENIFAEAISGQDFKYFIHSVGESRLDKSGKQADNTYGGHYIASYERFLEMLSELNGAEITEERFKEDGLALTETLGKIRSHIRKLENEVDSVKVHFTF